MTITAVGATYQVRIADRGATTVAGNVALTLALADLNDIPRITGPTVQLLDGKSVSSPFRVDCIVDDVLFVSSNRLAVIGRLIEIRRSEDGGSSWTTLATGRIKGASELDGRGKVTLEVSDERWVERDTEIFGTTDTVQLHPPGLGSAFMGWPAAGAETYVVLAVSGNAVKIEATRIATSTKILKVPRSLRLALRDDLVAVQDIDTANTNSDGNFTSLRFDLDSGGPTPGDYKVISFANSLGGLVNTFTVLGDLRPGGDGVLTSAWVYFGSGHGLVADDEIVGRFYFTTGIPTRENVPLHIGGADGVHPMTLLKDILDGDYGGQAVLYDATAMSTLEALPFPKVWLRVEEAVQRDEWLAENLYRPYGIAPLVGTDLVARPTQFTLPADVNVGALPVITASDESQYSWRHDTQDLVTAIRFSFTSVDEVTFTGERGDDWPVDELETALEPIKPNPEHDTVSTLGEVVQEYVTALAFGRGGDYSARSRAADVAYWLAEVLFNVCGDAPQRGDLRVPDDSGHEVGDLVVLDHDTIKGFNPDTGGRTGDRLVRLITPIEQLPASTLFEFLGMGPASAALAAPTVSVAQNGTDPDLIDVTISGLPSGATAVVQAETGATTPSVYGFVRSGVGNETIQFRVGAGSGTAYVRAKSVAPSRVESAWDTDSVALSARARIDAASVIRTSVYDFEVTWDVPSGTPAMKTDYAIHSRLEEPSFGDNIQDYDSADGGFSVSGALRSIRDVVTVRLTPYPTLNAGPTAAGTAGELVEIRAIFVQTRA